MANKVKVKQVKAALNIKGNSKDEVIDTWIPLVYESLEGYVGWTDLTVIKMIQYNMDHRPGVSAESLSRHSISFLHSYPPGVTKGVRRKL